MLADPSGPGTTPAAPPTHHPAALDATVAVAGAVPGW